MTPGFARATWGGGATTVAAHQENARFIAVDDPRAHWTLDPPVGEMGVGPK